MGCDGDSEMAVQEKPKLLDLLLEFCLNFHGSFPKAFTELSSPRTSGNVLVWMFSWFKVGNGASLG